MLSLLLILISYISCSLAFSASIPQSVSTTVEVHKNFSIIWTREASDPLQFAFKLRSISDEVEEDLPPELHNSDGLKQSIASIRCDVEGTFQLDILYADLTTVLFKLPDIIRVVENAPDQNTENRLPTTKDLDGNESSTALPQSASEPTSSPITSLSGLSSASDVPQTSPETPQSFTSSNKVKTAAIAGGVLGGLAFFALVMFSILIYLRHKDQAARKRRLARIPFSSSLNTFDHSNPFYTPADTLVGERSAQSYNGSSKRAMKNIRADSVPLALGSVSGSVRSNSSNGSGVTRALANSYAGLYKSIYQTDDPESPEPSIISNSRRTSRQSASISSMEFAPSSISKAHNNTNYRP